MIFHFQPSSSPVRWHWATLIGPDALDFLQRVTSANTNAMQLGQGAKGCFLTAQGKIRAYFTLWNYAEDKYGFEFDAGAQGRWKEALFSAVDQYTFAEKITLTDVTNLECRWILTDSSSDLPADLAAVRPGQTLALNEEIRVCHHGERDFGKTWITVWGEPSKLVPWINQNFSSAKTVSWDELEGWRIQATRPWVDRELTDATIPLEAGLADAIAPNKGCYPGQEVIEKIVSLGAPAKRLVKIEGQGEAPALGAKALSTAVPPAEIGTITSVHRDGNRFTALAFVRKTHAQEGFGVRFENSSSQATIAHIAPYA